MVRMADALQIYKYCIHNVAHSYGKTATFMPKPVYGDNGSGMHVHQSIWKAGKPLFAGNGYADLSEMALYYIGGIIKHAKALNAFTNPSTNSYKRLIPGFEAPVLLAYSARNRSASCRIPYATNPKAKRVEVRFPDPTANPYLAFSAMLMAGLDGIRNKIHPGDPMDKDLYDLPPEELKGIPTVCGSLREALQSLEADHDFLLAGDVFSTRPDRELYRAQMERGVHASSTPRIRSSSRCTTRSDCPHRVGSSLSTRFPSPPVNARCAAGTPALRRGFRLCPFPAPRVVAGIGRVKGAPQLRPLPRIHREQHFLARRERRVDQPRHRHRAALVVEFGNVVDDAPASRLAHRHLPDRDRDLVLLGILPHARDVGLQRVEPGIDAHRHAVADQRIGGRRAGRGAGRRAGDRVEHAAPAQQERQQRDREPAAPRRHHCKRPQRDVAGSAVAHFQTAPSRQTEAT